MSEFDETKRRINRVNAEVGGLVQLENDWDEVDALAEAFDFVSPEFPHDEDVVAQRLAAYLVKAHVEACEAAGARSVHDRWFPEHDDAAPAKMATLYVLSHTNHTYVIPLREARQVKDVATELRSSRCEARVTRSCKPESASKFLAVSRGEYICLFNICRACLQHIDSRAGFNQDYTGPAEEWLDNRTANVRSDDIWDI